MSVLDDDGCAKSVVAVREKVGGEFASVGFCAVKTAWFEEDNDVPAGGLAVSEERGNGPYWQYSKPALRIINGQDEWHTRSSGLLSNTIRWTFHRAGMVVARTW